MLASKCNETERSCEGRQAGKEPACNGTHSTAENCWPAATVQVKEPTEIFDDAEPPVTLTETAASAAEVPVGTELQPGEVARAVASSVLSPYPLAVEAWAPRPTVRDGITGRDGVDAVDTEADTAATATTVEKINPHTAMMANNVRRMVLKVRNATPAPFGHLSIRADWADTMDPLVAGLSHDAGPPW